MKRAITLPMNMFYQVIGVVAIQDTLCYVTMVISAIHTALRFSKPPGRI